MLAGFQRKLPPQLRTNLKGNGTKRWATRKTLHFKGLYVFRKSNEPVPVIAGADFYSSHRLRIHLKGDSGKQFATKETIVSELP
jgi:hypothetical protein